MNILSGTKRVAVLRGGPSEEYDISMNTGKGVLEALDGTNLAVDDIVITRTGEWLKQGRVMQPQDALATTDVAFIALHGAFGEDGTVQRLLERYSVPYTGSGPYASAIAMNKVLTKEHLKDLGIKMAPHMRVTAESRQNIARIVGTITTLFGPEYVVKPIASGSSIGTAIVDSPKKLIFVLEDLLRVYDDVLVEQRIFGREATCGVVERFRDQKLYRLPSIEIVPPPHSSFFDNNVKYSGETDEICPGRFKAEEKRRLEELAELVHTTLGLRQYSRSDFIVAKDDIYFLEVNTLPGLTKNSLVPKSLDAVGCSYQDFILHLLTDALIK